MKKTISVSKKNRGFIYDKSRGIYVSRGLLRKDNRVMDAVKCLDTKVINPSTEFKSPVQIVSAKGTELLLSKLQPYLPNTFSRMLTKSEYLKYYNWAKNNDEAMFKSMDDSFGELVYDNRGLCSKKFLLANVFNLSISPEPEFENAEKLLGYNPLGMWYGIREVIDSDIFR